MILHKLISISESDKTIVFNDENGMETTRAAGLDITLGKIEFVTNLKIDPIRPSPDSLLQVMEWT